MGSRYDADDDLVKRSSRPLAGPSKAQLITVFKRRIRLSLAIRNPGLYHHSRLPCEYCISYHLLCDKSIRARIVKGNIVQN